MDGEGMEALRHDHALAELEYALEFSGINQVISVQARARRSTIPRSSNPAYTPQGSGSSYSLTSMPIMPR